MSGSRFLDTKKIMAEIQANQSKLMACERHTFVLPTPPYNLGMKLTCIHCGGIMDAISARSYALGYQAAGKSIEDVMPGWNK